MPTGARIGKDHVARLTSSLRHLEARRVLIGIPGEKTERKETDGAVKADEPTNAEIGYEHEFGDPSRNLPARPWLVPGVMSAKNDVTRYMRQAGEYALQGDEGGIDRAFHAVGLSGQSAVKNKLRTGPFVPLSPATLAARRERGVLRINPLIDTGQLLNAVSYAIIDTKSARRTNQE